MAVSLGVIDLNRFDSICSIWGEGNKIQRSQHEHISSEKCQAFVATDKNQQDSECQKRKL